MPKSKNLFCIESERKGEMQKAPLHLMNKHRQSKLISLLLVKWDQYL